MQGKCSMTFCLLLLKQDWLLSEPKDKFLASLANQQTLAALHLSPSLLTSMGYKYTVITSFDDDPEVQT